MPNIVKNSNIATFNGAMKIQVKNSKVQKIDLIKDILKAYRHDEKAEGPLITKRRLWYIMKSPFAKIPKYRIIEEDKEVWYLKDIYFKGKPVKVVTNNDFNKYFNILASEDEIDDTFIHDSSRKVIVGDRLPEIIIATEKDTITTTAEALAESLGLSLYVMGGFSSIYAAKNLEAAIGKSLTVLVLTDYDKSGFKIQETAVRHFKDAAIHRVLLNPNQIPEDKLDEWFNESANLGKWYELDVLNIHQLQDVFLSNVPGDIVDLIKEAFIEDKVQDIMYDEVQDAVSENERIIALRAELEDLEYKLEQTYEGTFLEASPITFPPFNIKDIHKKNVRHHVAKWR